MCSEINIDLPMDDTLQGDRNQILFPNIFQLQSIE